MKVMKWYGVSFRLTLVAQIPDLDMAAQYDPLWHARQLCGISISNADQ